jgi:tripeptide aminopeptidase
VQSFGAEWAYTVDGGSIGELEYENFNAAAATIVIYGRNVHPGSAKNKMVNASRVASQIVSTLPQDQTPENTEGYEGFIHLTSFEGNVEQAQLKFIIRDHDAAKFEEKKETLKRVVNEVCAAYKDAKVEINIKDQYHNMLEKIKPVMHVVDIAKQAIENVGVTPKVQPIRGGTDGANLSFKGLPCPNLFTGGENFHSCYEYVPVPSMVKASEMLIEIVRLVANR